MLKYFLFRCDMGKKCHKQVYVMFHDILKHSIGKICCSG